MNETHTRDARTLGCYVYLSVMFGILLTGLSLDETYQGVRTLNWVQVPAVIHGAHLGNAPRSSAAQQRRGTIQFGNKMVFAKYSYKFNNATYEGSKVTPLNHTSGLLLWRWNEAKHRELLSHEDSGALIPCYVNPGNPKEAVLYREHIFWPPLVLIGFALGLFTLAYLMWRQKVGKPVLRFTIYR